jgi:hypothetical protein
MIELNDLYLGVDAMTNDQNNNGNSGNNGAEAGAYAAGGAAAGEGLQHGLEAWVLLLEVQLFLLVQLQ